MCMYVYVCVGAAMLQPEHTVYAVSVLHMCMYACVCALMSVHSILQPKHTLLAVSVLHICMYACMCVLVSAFDSTAKAYIACRTQLHMCACSVESALRKDDVLELHVCL